MRNWKIVAIHYTPWANNNFMCICQRPRFQILIQLFVNIFALKQSMGKYILCKLKEENFTLEHQGHILMKENPSRSVRTSVS